MFYFALQSVAVFVAWFKVVSKIAWIKPPWLTNQISWKKEKRLDLWGFVSIKSCYYGWRHEFGYSWISGVGVVNPLLWQPDTSQHHKIGLRIEPRHYCGTMKQGINERYDAELSTEKKKGHIFFVSKIFHNKSTLYLVKPSLWTNASPYFNSVYFRQCGSHLDTHSLSNLIIPNNNKWFLGDSSQVFFNRALHFGIFSRCERRHPYVKGCNSGASQKISWE